MLSIGTKIGDHERRNGRVVCVILPNSVALGPYYQTFWFEAINRWLSPIDRLKGSGEIVLSIA